MYAGHDYLQIPISRVLRARGLPRPRAHVFCGIRHGENEDEEFRRVSRKIRATDNAVGDGVRVGMHVIAAASRQVQKKAYPYGFERNSRGDGRSTQKLEPNKQTVTAVYDLMFNHCPPAEAVDKYGGDVYIRHNPMVADGNRRSSPTSFAWRRNTRRARLIQTGDRRGQLCGAALLSAMAPRLRLGRDGCFSSGRERENRRALGCPPAHPADICKPQHP